MTADLKSDFRSLVEERALHLARDPRPRATIRVGAIGHRKIDETARRTMTGTVQKVLKAIQSAAEGALQQRPTSEQFIGGLDLVVVSPLAEGADRLIAHAGLAQNYQLGAVLPFAVPDYEATFDLGDRVEATADFRALLAAAALPKGYGVLVLDGDTTGGPPRNAAFLDCAKAVSRWSDIMIAILAEGRESSQTGCSVRDAVNMGVPVVVIDPQRPDVFTLRTIDVDRGSSSADPAGRLAEFVVSMLAPSAAPVPAAGKRSIRRSRFGLKTYCSEQVDIRPNWKCDFEYSGPYEAKAVAPTLVRHCSNLNRWIENRIRHAPTDQLPEPEDRRSIWNLPFDRTAAAPFVDLFLRYHRADVIANVYADLQRSVQIVVAFLGVATVTFAAIATQVEGFSSVIFAGLELVTLVLALSLVWLSHRQAWHDRWLDCRLLAEILRYSKFLLLTGVPSPFADLRGSFTARVGKRTWTRDHAEDVLRAHRLSVPGRGAQSDAGAARSIAEYIAAQCIDDQARYHFKTGRLRLKYGDILKKTGIVVSVVTVCLVGIVFLLEVLLFGRLIPAELIIEPWRGAGEVLVIILPALTAGLLAMRAFGEHEVIGLRSLAMMETLEKERSLAGNAAGMTALGDAMLRIARLLLRDVDGWRELFSGKHLEA